MTTAEQARAAGGPIAARVEFETLIADTSAALMAAGGADLVSVVERTLDRVRLFLRADRCALLAVSPDQRVVRLRFAAYGESIPRVSAELNLAERFPWSSRRLLIDRQPVRITSLEDVPAGETAERAMRLKMGIKSALTIPVETRGMVSHIILLNALHDEVDWPEIFIPRLRVLGQLLSAALDRQATFEQLQQAEAILASGAELAGLAHYETDFANRIARVDGRFRALCGVPADSGDGARAMEFWSAHLHPDDQQRVLRLRQELFAGRSEQFSSEYRYLHPAAGERLIHHVARVSRRDAAGRPLRSFGVLRDITESRKAEHDLARLGRRLIEAHEAERALLARELHDDVTQRLAVLAIDVGRAELAAKDEAHGQAMRGIRDGLVRLSEDVHALAYQLHPSVLEELGLAEALRTECERVGRRSAIKLSLDLPPDALALAKDAALCLFRVAQEALSNVVRHAGASAAHIALRRMDAGWALSVRDDGGGFDPARSSSARSLGLASMRERVDLVHGTFDIESGAGRGTTVTAWVPSPGASA